MADVYYYKNRGERASIIARENGNGKSVIHDDFVDEDGRRTNGASGRLTMDVVADTPNPDRDRLKELSGFIADGFATLPELNEYIKLRDGL